MVKGIGIDIIEIERIKEAVEKYGKTFLTKIYTPSEIKYCTGTKTYRYPELAVRFAAKEAYSKAMGTGVVNWKDIEVKKDKAGKPLIAVKGKLNGKAQVSLSHSRDYAVASVYVEK